MLLQETHWDAVAAAQWEALLPAARVVWLCAGTGPGGGRQGSTGRVFKASLTYNNGFRHFALANFRL